MVDTELEDRGALREMFRRSRRGEFFAILASGFAGVLSLAVSTYNVYLTRSQVQAQVWPHLEWLYGTEDGFNWKVVNSGVGPAKIMGARMTLNGREFKRWSELVDLLKAENPQLVETVERCGWSSVGGRVLGAQGEIGAFHCTIPAGPDARDHKQALVKLLTTVNADICFCSTLDDCWMLGSHGTVSVKKCPTKELTFSN